ncbi:MAG: hypothetical protein EHM42_15805, partial [Planctomycetaceae bacterium]
MAASIGEYAISVKADAREFQKGMEQVLVATKQTTLAITQTTTQTMMLAGGAKNSTFAIQQLAFGLQDAASVMGTAGFGGAIRAASNNVIQFASLINPLAGTIAAVALTGVQVLADSFRSTTTETEKATKAIKDYTAWVKDAEKAASRFEDVQKLKGEDKSTGAKQTADTARQQIDRDNKLVEEARARLEELRTRSLDVQARVAQRGGMLSAGTPTEAEQAEIAGNVESREKVRGSIMEAKERIKANEELEKAARERQAELQKKEQQEKLDDLRE